MSDDECTRKESRMLEKAIDELRKKRNASGKPAEGIWYYIWLKPNWKFFSVQNGERMHCEMWERFVKHEIKDHYKLNDEDVDKIEDVLCSMPRGRCNFVNDRFELYHGDDFPSGKNAETEKTKIMGWFNLTALYFHDRDKVKFVFDPHYKMSQEEKDIVESVLGPIPY
jgi:hypothetical protein